MNFVGFAYSYITSILKRVYCLWKDEVFDIKYGYFFVLERHYNWLYYINKNENDKKALFRFNIYLEIIKLNNTNFNQMYCEDNISIKSILRITN